MPFTGAGDYDPHASNPNVTSAPPSGAVFGSSATNDQLIWSPGTITSVPRGEHSGPGGTFDTFGYASRGSILNQIAAWDQGKVSALQEALYMAGFVNIKSIRPGFLDGPTLTGLNALFDLSLRSNSGKPDAKKVPWTQFLTDQAGKGPGGSSGGGYHSTSTSTSTSVSLTDKVTAGKILENSMTQLLGRAPKPEEIKAFVASLNGDERKHPSTSSSTTTSSGDASGNSSSHTSSSSTSTSSDPSAFADNFVTSDDKLDVERGTYGIQNFATVFEQLLGGDGKVTQL